MYDDLVESLESSPVVMKNGYPYFVHPLTDGVPHMDPKVLKETSLRQKEMEHIGAAYMAEGIVTLAGSRLYTSAAYTEEMIDDVLSRFDKVFANCGKLSK